MKSASNKLRRARPLLGTFVEIAAAGAPQPALDAALDAAFAAVTEVHRLMSFHERASDVGRLNRQASRQSVTVHPWTFQVLETALDLSHRSLGVFDITVAPVLQELGLLPGDARSAVAASADLAIDLLGDCQVRFRHPGVRIDLGGIAKGFAVDRAVDVLRARGVSQGVVNAGGDLAAFGAEVELVHIRDPRDPRRIMGEVALHDAALASSGAAFDPVQGGAGVALAVIDPHTRKPAATMRGATVRAPSCMIADALTKIVMIAGEAATPLLREEHASALLASEDGDVRITADWHAAVRRAA